MSEEYFKKVKMTRGDVNDKAVNNVRDMEYFRIYDSDTVVIDTARRDIVVYTRPSITSFYELANPIDYSIKRNESISRPPMIDIVVAYYGVSIDWLFEAVKKFPKDTCRVWIYYKNDDKAMIDKYRGLVWSFVKLDNIGRCDHSYVYHIVNNYNSKKLAPMTLFIKDSAIVRHSDNSDVLQWINKGIQDILSGDDRFNGLAVSFPEDLYNWQLDEYSMAHDQNGNKDPYTKAPKFLRPFHRWMDVVMEGVNASVIDITRANYGGVFFFKTSAITRIPLKNWVRIGISISLGPNLEIGHYLERSWMYLLDVAP
jgi:hypothetical protein